MTLQELHDLIGRRLEQDKRLGALPVVAAHYHHGSGDLLATELLGVHGDHDRAVLTFRARPDQ